MQFETLLDHVESFLSKKEDMKLKSLLLKQEPRVLADIIGRLDHGKRKTFATLPPELQAQVVMRMPDRDREIVFPRLSDHTVARFLHFNDEDDAADIIQTLPEERRPNILQYLRPEQRMKVEKLLLFNPESAGGLMDLNFISVRETDTVKDVLEQVRSFVAKQKHTPVVAVVDEHGKVKGFVPHKKLFVSPLDHKVTTIEQALPSLHHTADQEQVLKIGIREKTDVFGVVDDRQHLLGVIHSRDILRIAQIEATEDVYKFAGVSREEQILDSPLVAIRMRYRWLILNLATAFLAAFVVSLFQDTISSMAILAAYMPIVAGMGGNSGTQTLAVVVRGIALGEVSRHHLWRVVWHQAVAGLANGIINGAIAAGLVTLFTGDGWIGLILGLAMVINLVIAGVFGALTPVILRSMKVDPAVASSVFVTTATDIFGFLSFLGLATLFLM